MSVSDYPVAVIFIQLCKSIANAAPFVKELNGRGINFYPRRRCLQKGALPQYYGREYVLLILTYSDEIDIITSVVSGRVVAGNGNAIRRSADAQTRDSLKGRKS